MVERLLRIVVGVCLILGVGSYYFIAMLFILGSTDFNPAYAWSFGICGMFAAVGPLIVLGAYLVFLGPDAGMPARRVMLWALIGTQLFGLAGMAPHLVDPTTRGDAAETIVSGLISTVLFGWPIVKSWLQGRLSQPD